LKYPPFPWTQNFQDGAHPLLQALTENDKQLRTVFSVNMLEFLENDDFGDRIVFSGEATFHINGSQQA
jgi:hypothetical protein